MRQTHRTLLTVGVLMLAAAAASLYAWRDVARTERSATERQEHETRLWAPTTSGGDPTADGGALTRLAITYEGTTTVVERQPGAPWRVVAPVSARADQATVEALVTQLTTARFTAALEEAPDAGTLERYGLTHPTFVVEATASAPGDAPRTLRLEGGAENAFDGSSFVRRDGEPAVFAAPGALRAAATKTTYELRDKRVLTIDEAPLRSIAMKSLTHAWTLSRDAQGRWALVRPTADAADAVRVTTMVSGLGAERAHAFATDVESLRRRFDAPLLDATFLRSDGGSVRFRFARPRADGGVTTDVLREDEEGALAAEVVTSATSHLDLPVSEFEERAIAPFDKTKAVRIVVTLGDAAPIVLEKPTPEASAEAWRVTSPRAGKALVLRVTSLLWSMSALRAASWGEKHPKDWQRYGLDAHARTIAFFGADGALLARVDIGAEVPGQPGTSYVRGRRPQVALTENVRFGQLPTTVDDLLEEPDDAGRSER